MYMLYSAWFEIFAFYHARIDCQTPLCYKSQKAISIVYIPRMFSTEKLPIRLRFVPNIQMYFKVISKISH